MPLNAALQFIFNLLRVLNKIFVLQEQVQMIQLGHNHVVNAVNMKRKNSEEPVSENISECNDMSLQKVMASIDDIADERKFINPRQLEAVRQNYLAGQHPHQNRIRKHENATGNVKKVGELYGKDAITRVMVKDILAIFAFISAIMKVPDDLIDFSDVLVSDPESLEL